MGESCKPVEDIAREIADALRKPSQTNRISVAGRGCNQHVQMWSWTDSMIEPQTKQSAGDTQNTGPSLPAETGFIFNVSSHG